jgi:hypothetical protein
LFLSQLDGELPNPASLDIFLPLPIKSYHNPSKSTGHYCVGDR